MAEAAVPILCIDFVEMARKHRAYKTILVVPRFHTGIIESEMKDLRMSCSLPSVEKTDFRNRLLFLLLSARKHSPGSPHDLLSTLALALPAVPSLTLLGPLFPLSPIMVLGRV